MNTFFSSSDPRQTPPRAFAPGPAWTLLDHVTNAHQWQSPHWIEPARVPAAAVTPDRPGGILARARTALRQWFQRTRAHREVGQLSNRDRRDAGLPAISQVDGRFTERCPDIVACIARPLNESGHGHNRRRACC